MSEINFCTPSFRSPEITFSQSLENSLNVVIRTENLLIRSVCIKDLSDYISLFTDEAVMESYASGKPYTVEQITKRVNESWIPRWTEKTDPYSAFAVLEEKTGEFLGHIVLGHGDRPGQSELAGLGRKDFWEKGYGKEAAHAIVLHYAPATIAEGYLLDGVPLDEITATARTTNTASNRILSSLGMQIVKEDEKYGSLRNHYSLHIKDIQTQTSAVEGIYNQSICKAPAA